MGRPSEVAKSSMSTWHIHFTRLRERILPIHHLDTKRQSCSCRPVIISTVQEDPELKGKWKNIKIISCDINQPTMFYLLLAALQWEDYFSLGRLSFEDDSVMRSADSNFCCTGYGRKDGLSTAFVRPLASLPLFCRTQSLRLREDSLVVLSRVETFMSPVQAHSYIYHD